MPIEDLKRMQNYAALGVNLSRGKFGPLDVSCVFYSKAALTWYLSYAYEQPSATHPERPSSIDENFVARPYEGQIIAVEETEGGNTVVKVYVLGPQLAAAKADLTWFDYTEVGAKTLGDGNSIDLSDGVLSIHGFSSATDNQIAFKNTTTGKLEWASIGSLLTAGNGIDITNNTISVKLTATNSGLSESSDGLKVAIKTDGGVAVDSDGLSVDTNKIASKESVDDLDERVKNLESRGRFLSNWNATTGLPTTYPTIPEGATYPVEYKYLSGDYYIIETVPESGTKYKPSGTSITKQSSSAAWVVGKTAETSTIAVGDYYTFDGTNWTLLSNPQKTVSFKMIAGQPSDNANLATALNAKQNTIDAEHKLSADLVDDSSATNKFTTAEDIEKLAGIEEGAEVNVLEGIQVAGNDIEISSKKSNIGLDSELTYDTSSKKVKITRPSTANGQVLTAKSDGTVTWEYVGTGDQLFKDASGNGFATKAEFDTAAAYPGNFYLANGTKKDSNTITKGDYVIIASDSSHSSAQTRYGYKNVAGSYAANNWAFEYTLGSAYTGENGVQINGTTISAKLDGASLAATSSGLKINDGWSGDVVLILNGGNAALTEN